MSTREAGITVMFGRIGRNRRNAPESDDFHQLARSRGYIKARNFKKLARSRGYVKEIGLAEMIGAQRFSVDEVIDVGVYAGTDWLYDTFRDARFVLVEPIPDGEALLRWTPDSYTFVNCGLGAEPGRLTLNRYNNERLDSILGLHNIAENVSHRRQLAERVEVAVDTLDHIIEEHCTSDNIGIKIDTEGFELEVLRGLEKHKERVTFIVAESSVVRRHLDSYQFSDLVAELRAKNFYFLNVMNPQKRTAVFYDSLFVQKEDPRLEVPVDRIDDLGERDRATRKLVLSRSL
jgi:FkbM family methyltransferase